MNRNPLTRPTAYCVQERFLATTVCFEKMQNEKMVVAVKTERLSTRRSFVRFHYACRD